MLTIAAPSSTSCIRSRYWRRNACQPGSFSASASLFGPNSARRSLDLGGVEAGARVDLEPRARLLGREPVPGDGVARLLRDRRHRRLGLERGLRLLQRGVFLVASSLGNCGSMRHQRVGETAATAIRANHLRSAGITCHGADSVLVWREHLRERALVVVPVARAPATSAAENFQFLSGSSMRARKRLRCSSLREVEEQLHDVDAVVDEVALPVVDLAVAPLPDVPPRAAVGQLLRARAAPGARARRAPPRSASG